MLAMARLQMWWTCALLVVNMLAYTVLSQDRIEMKCNPSIRHRYDKCPADYCCVRDEFLPTFVFCRKIGELDDNCATKENESECPCGTDLYCRANIMGAFPSVYGRCRPNVTSTTSTSTTASSTTTTTATTMISETTVADNSNSTSSASNSSSSTNSSESLNTTATNNRFQFPLHLPIIG